MPEPVCTICKGLSWTDAVIGNEVVSFRCMCFKRRLALNFLGPELARAKLRRSALYCPEIDPETNEVVGDRTLDNLFIKGDWPEVSEHLRWAVGAKHYDVPQFTFKMVNDDLLLRVYLGDFKYSNRSKHVRDEIETYNGQRDLVADCSLLIVRLGNLGHPNRAAGNVLQECLNIRASNSKPTWLIEGATPFGEGHLFYNYDVGNYIEDNFETINVGGDVESARRMAAELQALKASSYSMDDSGGDRLPAPPTQERYKATAGEWEEKGRSKPRAWSKGKKTGGGQIVLDDSHEGGNQ